MSKCRITPVLITVLVFLFVLNGCGRGMELQELTQQLESVHENSGEPAEEAGTVSAGGRREGFRLIRRGGGRKYCLPIAWYIYAVRYRSRGCTACRRAAGWWMPYGRPAA